MATNSAVIEMVNPSGLIEVISQTKALIQDGEGVSTGGVPGVIMPRGVLPVPGGVSAGTEIIRWPYFADHWAISGYKKLGTVSTDKRYNLTTSFEDNPGSPPVDTLMEEFATQAGDFDGVDSNNSTKTWRVRARQTASSGSRENFIVAKAYHRTSGGTETFLTEGESGVLTTTLANYDFDITIDQAWGTNELLVVKYYVRAKGIPV